jgi:signal transduction histidine kinase
MGEPYKAPTVVGDISSLIVASHELKTPLVLLRQLSLSLADDRLSDVERQLIVTQMKLVSERALRLTSDLTKTQRLEDGLFTMEPVNPQQICEDVVRELSPLYAACGRSIEFRKSHRSSLAVANRDLLRRILINFADNALYYADEQSPVTLNIETKQRGDLIRLGVRDYGPAVPVNVWQRLSRNEVQNESIRARPASSGLGLMIARQFAEAMNGKVGVTRHRDGATFYVDMYASKQMSLL